MLEKSHSLLSYPNHLIRLPSVSKLLVFSHVSPSLTVASYIEEIKVFYQKKLNGDLCVIIQAESVTRWRAMELIVPAWHTWTGGIYNWDLCQRNEQRVLL
ncbi:hypothetical protein QCA50_015475 [Cerrena zonata]|uniref:Uncharacterized protein n=1 Tax=Cerrena zonata TaxID=2478898 RepID=A0AAW0FI62_9APHY